MPVAASLPAYGHVTQEAVQCIAQASSRYEVPELLLHAIIKKENGRMSKCSKNTNGTYDCGYAQINSGWVKEFSKYGITQSHITNDTCTNVSASAYVLKDYFQQKKGKWFDAIVAYNIGPNKWTKDRYAIGYRYATDVVQYWWEFQKYVDAVQTYGGSTSAASATQGVGPKVFRSDIE